MVQALAAKLCQVFSAHKSGSFVKKIYRNYKIRRQIRQSVNLNYYNFPQFDNRQLVGIVVANEPREGKKSRTKRNIRKRKFRGYFGYSGPLISFD